MKKPSRWWLLVLFAVVTAACSAPGSDRESESSTQTTAESAPAEPSGPGEPPESTESSAPAESSEPAGAALRTDLTTDPVTLVL